MRQRQVLLLGLLAGLLAGCATGPPVSYTSWLGRLRPFHGPTGPDVIQIDVALLERPIGDPFINQELWAVADEQSVPLERKALLCENGFRVGQLGGMTPAGLQTLLTSERSCINPRRLYLRAGHPTVLTLGPAVASCRFHLPQDGEAEEIVLEQAECTFNVVPSLGSDGRTRLQFTPLIRHGEKTMATRAAPDGDGWTLQEEQPARSFAALSWEMNLAPNHYAIVGGRPEPSGTLGCVSFLRPEELVPVQRLLVIRACRTSAAAPDDPADAFEDAALSRAPPLALQAAWTTARGSAR